MLDFLSPYKLLIEIAIIGALIGGAFYGVHRFLQYEQQIGYDKRASEDAVLAAQIAESNRKEVERLSKQITEAQNAATQREQTIRTTAAAVNTASSGLRDATTAIINGLPTATNDAIRQSATALAIISNDCQGRYREVAEKADRHASDVKTLTDAWPKPKDSK